MDSSSTEHEDWRVGSHYNLHVYTGGDDSSYRETDRPVATFHRPEDAARAVADHQDAPALRAEVRRLTGDLARAMSERDTLVRGWEQRRDAALAERDAARAELAAAHNTDGLPKPYEEIREEAGRLHIGYGSEECWAHPRDNPNWLRYHAANALALANEIDRRARLEDEATPKDNAQ